MKVAAYIPCYNNRETLLEVIASIRAQTAPVDELLVVDDGSTDTSPNVARSAGVMVTSHPRNLGRGPTRRRGMEGTSAPLVACCDATNVLPPDFIARSLEWFAQADVAAVYGRISQRPGGNAVNRWRGRHLFKIDGPHAPAGESSSFATYGAVVRRSAVDAVGNYDVSLRHTEDAELGTRLRQAGWKIICDPDLVVYSVVQNTLAQTLERYWRWYAGADERIAVKHYLKSIWFSLRCMVPQDLRAGDPVAGAISLMAPHYQFWKSALRKLPGAARR